MSYYDFKKNLKAIREALSKLYPGARLELSLENPSSPGGNDYKTVSVEYNKDIIVTHGFNQKEARAAIKKCIAKFDHTYLKSVTFKPFTIVVKPNNALVTRIVEAYEESNIELDAFVSSLKLLADTMTKKEAVSLHEVIEVLLNESSEA